jgi:hypothetical protein
MSEPLRSFRGLVRHSRVLILCAVVATLGMTAGVAFAYWALSGAGSASAASSSLGAVTVAAFTGGDAPSTSLLPGGSSDVVLRLNNTNSFPITVTAIALNGTIVATGGIGTCATTGVSVTFPSSPSINVASGSHLIDLSGAAAMSLASQTGCQGATFDIPVSISFQK